MNKSHLFTMGALGLLALPISAYSEINFNGFATLTGGRTADEDERLHGYDEDFSFEDDSFIGLQANADLGEGLSAVVQFVSRGENDWDTEVEWAYLGYEASENVKILIGRQRVPFYIYSDFIDVGYTYHWINPPESAYSVPFNSTNGISAIISNQLGPVNSRVHVIYGRNKEQLTIQGSIADSDIKNLLGINWTLEYEWLNFRIGYSEADLVIDLTIPPFPSAFGELEGGDLIATWEAAGFGEYKEHILANDDNNKGSFFDAGFTIDYKSLLIISEFTKLETEGTITAESEEGYYVSFGYRFGKIMPHITHGESKTTPSNTSFISDEARTHPLGGAAALYTDAIFDSFKSETSYQVIGLRWDFHPSAAFKVDYKMQKDELAEDDATDNLLRFSVSTLF